MDGPSSAWAKGPGEARGAQEKQAAWLGQLNVERRGVGQGRTVSHGCLFPTLGSLGCDAP